MHPNEAQSVQRRRGAALEEALLDAAWAVLLEHGYAGFTLEAVAARAGTSRPVLARRWAGRHELLHATMTHASRIRPVTTPRTGTLRGDLISLLRTLNDSRRDLATVMGVQLGGYYQETGTTLADLREISLSGQPSTVLDEILAAAAERGELDPARVTPRLRALPVDLLRHHLFMTMQPMSDADIEDIVDSIFLPLVRPPERDQQD
ncbi:TetR/AcrR family transcriptional regulator [Nocardia colli]|uniref:TetR/AcrR family transcriptional regulator n=1 Tax=Nocardia colli TaxID=2545717 RepID=A0A5N0DY01_9NOCA|nr:TetR/AcrR family transcriptional regulator [Nocardia colli]KAA8882017.1 TetR/AcrR family transcriptional regulator [Nocardia colli]